MAEKHSAGTGKFLEWLPRSVSGVAEIGGSRTRRESDQAQFAEVLHPRNGDAHMGSPVSPELRQFVGVDVVTRACGHLEKQYGLDCVYWKANFDARAILLAAASQILDEVE
jgi:hypothetical protein